MEITAEMMLLQLEKMHISDSDDETDEEEVIVS